MRTKNLFLKIAVIALLLTSCAAPPAEKQNINLKGSDTMLQLGQRWAEAFMKDHPNAVIQVTGGGSGTGIAALINGTTQICQASRPMKDDEKVSVKQQRNADVSEIPVRMNDLIPGARLEGRVELDGQDVYSNSTDVIQLRRRVGMIFQRSNPFPMSIYENVAYGPRVNGLIKKRTDLDVIVEKTLRSAALWDEVKDRLSRSAMSLSGGQQQRLCIARALAVEPEVLLMDEPASALDPISTAKIEELIYQLKRNYTIVIVTHNMQQAARVSDETGFFLNGRLVEFAETKKLFTAPAKRETEDYITGRFG